MDQPVKKINFFCLARNMPKPRPKLHCEPKRPRFDHKLQRPHYGPEKDFNSKTKMMKQPKSGLYCGLENT